MNPLTWQNSGQLFVAQNFIKVKIYSVAELRLYSLLFPFQSIQTYVARVPVFWMVYFVCIFSSFRVFCIKVSRRRRKTVLIPQTNFLRLWHGKKNPWQYALKYFKTILPRTFLCLPCWQRLTFIATTRSSIFYRTIQTTWNSGTPPFHVSVVRHEEKCFLKSATTPFNILLACTCPLLLN